MNLVSAIVPGATALSAVGWPEHSVMLVLQDTLQLVAGLMGYAASAAVLGTFLMQKMVPLRMLAIVSNVLFILYGYAEHIYPVLCLHIALLPINTQRLLGSLNLPRRGRRFQPMIDPRSISWPGDFKLNIMPCRAVFFALGLLAGTAGGLIFIRIIRAAHV